MIEQIYINGTLMDQEGNKPISLVFQSPIFTDIDNIVSNRTNSVDFPATKNNLNAIDNCHMTSGASKFAYRRHTVKYYRDGIMIFSGYGTLLSITQTQIKFTFTWGNVGTFQKLLDYKLRELKNVNGGTIEIPWTDAYVASGRQFPKNVDTGGYAHPCMSVQDLLLMIETTTGVTIENKELLSDYRIPVTGKVASETSKRTQGLQLGSTIYRRTSGGSSKDCMAVGSADKDLRGMYLGEGLFDIEPYDTLRIIIPASFSYSCPVHSGKVVQQINFYAVDEDGNHPLQLGHVQLYKTESGARYIYKTYSTGFGQEIVVNLNVSDYTHLMIEIRAVASSQITATTMISGGIVVIPDYDQEQELLYGGTYPLISNLPDWTVSQLLKNLMKMEGLFPVCPDEKTIRLVSIDDLFVNRERALDVTDLLFLGENDGVTKEYSFGSYSQKNVFKYAEDSTVKTDASGAIMIDNANLSAESDLLTLDFAATDEYFNVMLPLYTENDEGGYDYADVTPRILKVKEIDENKKETLTFKGLEWPELIESRYRTYAAMVQNARVIKASMLMRTIDLANLDLTVPVYSYALGHYYAVISLTTKENGVADVELLQLNEVNINTEDEPELAVVNRNGVWMATFTNKTVAEIEAYRNSNDYRICLIRHGYTRRGKFRKFTNRYGEETSTKTSRYAKYNKTAGCPGYKQVRKEEGGGTPCWRIIGHELLNTGRIVAHSQVQSYYGDCTLVFKPHDPITLPPMRKKKKAMTKAGRLTNRAKDGLSELSIAVYKKHSDGKWRMASNVCTIRSRTEDKTRYWDFNPTNDLSL